MIGKTSAATINHDIENSIIDCQFERGTLKTDE